MFMEVAALCLRALDNNGAVYRAWSLDEDDKWTDAERELIASVMDKYAPSPVDAMYNNWHFSKVDDNFFIGKRATWTRGLFSGALEDVMVNVKAYYTGEWRTTWN